MCESKGREQRRDEDPNAANDAAAMANPAAAITMKLRDAVREGKIDAACALLQTEGFDPSPALELVLLYSQGANPRLVQAFLRHPTFSPTPNAVVYALLRDANLVKTLLLHLKCDLTLLPPNFPALLDDCLVEQRSGCGAAAGGDSRARWWADVSLIIKATAHLRQIKAEDEAAEWLGARDTAPTPRLAIAAELWPKVLGLLQEQAFERRRHLILAFAQRRREERENEERENEGEYADDDEEEDDDDDDDDGGSLGGKEREDDDEEC